LFTVTWTIFLNGSSACGTETRGQALKALPLKITPNVFCLFGTAT